MRTYPISQYIKSLKQQDSQIRDFFANNDLDNIVRAVEAYGQITENANLISFISNYYVQLGDYSRAMDILSQALVCYPFHFDLNFNLAITYELQSMLPESFYQYLIAFRVSGNVEEREVAQNYIERVQTQLGDIYSENLESLKTIINKGKNILAETDYREFPLDHYRQSTIRKLIQNDNSIGYMTNIYNNLIVDDMDDLSRYNTMTETLPGRVYAHEYHMDLPEPAVLPISVLKDNTRINFEINNNKYTFSGMDIKKNYHHYMRFNETGHLIVRMEEPVFIGEPIPIKDKPKKKKLVLNIFVDGIAYNFLKEQGLEKLMPHTHRYFSKGIIAENCYANSEWTYPSIASMYTGKYTTNHHIFHPDFNYDFASNNKMMQEYFKEAGYYTAQIGGDWRVTPAHGYYKGFDRILYQNYMGGMDCKKVVTEALEHLEAFKDKNNFLWLSLGDAHHVPDEIEQNLIIQTSQDISKRVNQKKKGETTVLSSYDANKHSKYGIEIKHIDFYLNLLYSYLNEQYEDDEIIVILHSDHGQSFLEDSPFLLHESRRKVPMMIKGVTNTGSTIDEFIETIDFLPSLLHWAELPAATGIDGKLPAAFGGEQARKFAYTEAIHPQQTYKAALTDETHYIYFENEEVIKQDGMIDLNNYSLQLINRLSGEDETDILPDQANYYEEVIWNHIKAYSKY